VDLCRAGPDDVDELARLLWLFAAPEEQVRQPVESFAWDLAHWFAAHAGSHAAFLARLPDAGAVGMAWVALVPRVPRPGVTSRVSGDLQSVFVLPEHRGRGIGTALVRAATEHAERRGARRVTVHSAPMAVPLYERLGFAASRGSLQRPPD
jgi:GNAT superfamily N-acetyltransferase